MRRPLTLALLLFTLAPGLASAQSLGELAAREREKRKAQKPTTKVITEEDLRRGTAGRGTINSGANEVPPTSAASPAPGAAAGPGTEKPKSEDEQRAEQEKAWREKLTQAQADVQRLSQALEVVNRSLADMSGNLYGASRTNQLAEAEKIKGELQAASQRQAALQEEGRRSRFRP